MRPCTSFCSHEHHTTANKGGVKKDELFHLLIGKFLRACFLPSFFWLCKTLFGKEGFPKRGISLLVITGIVLHAVLILSLLEFVAQKMSSVVLDFIQAVNASAIILLPWLGQKLLKIDGRELID